MMLKTLKKLLLLPSGWEENDFTHITKSIILYVIFFVAPEIVIRKVTLLNNASIIQIIQTFSMVGTLYLPLLFLVIGDFILSVFVFIVSKIGNKDIRIQSCISMVAISRLPTTLMAVIFIVTRNQILFDLGILYSFLILAVGFKVGNKFSVGRTISAVFVLGVLYSIVVILFFIFVRPEGMYSSM